MSCGILDWPLEQKKHISGKTDEIQTEPRVQLIVLYQCWSLSCDKFTGLRCAINNGGSWVKGLWDSLYYLCNISINLKLFQSKKAYLSTCNLNLFLIN